jgi:trimeric autotransporter adhesin
VLRLVGLFHAYIRLVGSAHGFIAGREGSAGGQIFTGASAYASVVGSEATDPLQFATNNTVVMTIANGGSVGIGTTTPDAVGFGWKTLTIKGGTSSGEAGVLELQSPTTTGAANLGIIAFLDGSTRGGQIYVQRDSSTTTANMLFATNGGAGIVERMRITSGGNVGIGTTEPVGILSVSSAIAKTDTTFTRLASFKSSEAYASYPLELSIAQRGNATSASQSIELQAGHYGLDFTANLVFQKDGGNVGIGTTSPSSFNAIANQLVVGNGTANQGITISTSTTTLGSLLFADSTVGADAYRGYVQYDHSLDKMSLATNGVAKLTIASTGEATFSSALTVASGRTVLKSTSDIYALALGYSSSASAYFYIGASADSSPDLIFSNGSPTERMRITSGGNVGIGTASPTSILTVLKTITTNFGAKGNAALSLGTAGSSGEANLINFGYDAGTWQPAYIGYLCTSGAGSSNGALVFATRSSTSDVQPTEALRIASTGAATFSSSITTAAPSGGTAQPFKIGSVSSGGPTIVNKLEVEINGVLYTIPCSIGTIP